MFLGWACGGGVIRFSVSRDWKLPPPPPVINDNPLIISWSRKILNFINSLCLQEILHLFNRAFIKLRNNLLGNLVLNMKYSLDKDKRKYVL